MNTAIALPQTDRLQAVRRYIKQTWQTLYRSHQHLVEAARDPKLEHPQDQPYVVYVPPHEDQGTIKLMLTQTLSAQEWRQIDLRVFPADPELIETHGLLYLPHPYIVPGGRFNEMYGWDSYFIQLGLLREGELSLAQNMVEQLLYEVEHYGTVLNANRTYMLSRSQPPVLTLMILALFEQTQDQAWLSSTLPMAERYYYYWTVPPHLNQATGLSRYFALGDGPSPEVLASEQDEQGRTHYERAKAYYRENPVTEYDLALYYNHEQDCLTDLFYKGDRSMRESGFDISNRFGPFSVDIIHYVPVCLNVLLYRMEQDLAQMHRILGNEEAVHHWNHQATERHHRIDALLWNESAGLYFDYNFHTNQQSQYEFATTFYPLWAGLASSEQAAKVVANLWRFEAPGGLLTSTHVTGNQWDAPFGWAPLTLIAVQGLLRYGYAKDAHRLACKFLSMVVQEFEKTGTLVEKYDVCACSAQVSDEILYGYSTNEVGFGWTNGVVLELLAIIDAQASAAS